MTTPVTEAKRERKRPDVESAQQRSARRQNSKRSLLIVADAACTSPEICAAARSFPDGGPTEALIIAPAHDSASALWYVDEDASRGDAERVVIGRLLRAGARYDGAVAAVAAAESARRCSRR